MPHKIGLLLPNSERYPHLALQFTDGLHLALDALPADRRPEIYFEDIGSSSRQESVLEKVQKLLIQNRVNLLIGFVGRHLQEALEAHAKKNRKLFYFTNLGANLFRPISDNPFVVVNTLQLWESTWATGRAAGQAEQKVAMASNFYASGYQISNAFVGGLFDAGGDVAGYQVPQQEWGSEEQQGLKDLIGPEKGNAVFANFSLPSVEAFLSGYDIPDSDATLYGHSLLSMPEHFSEDATASFSGHTTWVPELDNAVNQQFKEAFETEYGIPASVFGMLGYEAGLFTVQQLEAGTFDQRPPQGFPASPGPLETPRGTRHLHPSQRHYDGPVYGFQLEKEAGKEPVHTVTETMNLRKEMVEARSDESNHPEAGWMNTYLSR